MVKIRRLVKQTFQTFLKLVLAGKWLTPIVFAVTIIQLLSRKGARYAFNKPNRYLITQTKKYEHGKKYFSDKVKYSQNFEIVLEYCQVCEWNTALWEKGKRWWCIEFALLKDQERYMTDFWIKKNDILRLLNVFNFQRVLLAARKGDAIAL